jgi:NAD-dependent protein deacetylase/lipoamidase
MARNIVILTGAGISRESGLETFRDPDGIWAQVRVEDVATPEAFARDPERVLAFYNMRRRKLTSGEVLPNAAHRALARLEADWPGEFLLVTQNVDDLHERAGSRKLVHMHGESLKARCLACDAVVPWRADLDRLSRCPVCDTVGELRPDVVWFGEIPHETERIADALETVDLFVSIGTSGNVYPAAGFVLEARARGARTVELNLEPSEGASLFEEALYGKATELVPPFVERLAAERLVGQR